MELLLASASPSRRRLLEQACIPHRVQVSGIDEEAIQHADPLQLVQDLAIAKANIAFQKFIYPRGKFRWLAHFMIAVGCTSAFLITINQLAIKVTYHCNTEISATRRNNSRNCCNKA